MINGYDEESDYDDNKDESDDGDDKEGRDYDDDEEESYNEDESDDDEDDEEGRDYEDDELESDYEEIQLPHNLRLLRTFKACGEETGSFCFFLDNVFESVNSRYIAVRVTRRSKFPSSIDLLWNLHTLIISCTRYPIVPVEIWKLHQLRHLVFPGILPNPPSGDNNIVILEKSTDTKKSEELVFE